MLMIPTGFMSLTSYVYFLCSSLGRALKVSLSPIVDTEGQMDASTTVL